MRQIILVATLVLASLAGWPVLAQADGPAAIAFSQEEIRVITSWYREHGVEPRADGRGKKPRGLPPGIARNLKRGKPLPPGIAKQHLPQGLLASLPVPPKGYERVVVDGKILLVEVATRVIHDILSDVILG